MTVVLFVVKSDTITYTEIQAIIYKEIQARQVNAEIVIVVLYVVKRDTIICTEIQAHQDNGL